MQTLAGDQEGDDYVALLVLRQHIIFMAERAGSEEQKSKNNYREH